MKQDYWYFASPYSKHPQGIEEAFRQACREVGLLIRNGIAAYSPMCHTHPIATNCDMDPFDYKIWLPADKPMLDHAKGIIVCMMEGWDTSRGVQEELAHARADGRPIIYMTPGVVPRELL